MQSTRVPYAPEEARRLVRATFERSDDFLEYHVGDDEIAGSLKQRRQWGADRVVVSVDGSATAGSSTIRVRNEGRLPGTRSAWGNRYVGRFLETFDAVETDGLEEAARVLEHGSTYGTSKEVSRSSTLGNRAAALLIVLAMAFFGFLGLVAVLAA